MPVGGLCTTGAVHGLTIACREPHKACSHIGIEGHNSAKGHASCPQEEVLAQQRAASLAARQVDAQTQVQICVTFAGVLEALWMHPPLRDGFA